MAYLPGFDNDVFISYTHKDNLGPGALPDAGWVTRFHLDLQQRLSEFLGADARIWRDKKLRGSDDFSAEIFAQLKGSAVFIPVLSPGYLRSSWCQNELEEFQKTTLQSGGFEMGKVLGAHGQHRNILSRCRGYEFFVQRHDSSYFDAFDPPARTMSSSSAVCHRMSPISSRPSRARPRSRSPRPRPIWRNPAPTSETSAARYSTSWWPRTIECCPRRHSPST